MAVIIVNSNLKVSNNWTCFWTNYEFIFLVNIQYIVIGFSNLSAVFHFGFDLNCQFNESVSICSHSLLP